MKKIWAVLPVAMFMFSCNSEENNHDASGNFESDEVIVSSEQNGQLLSFTVQEGDSLSKGQVVGFIDSTNLVLQKQQVQATIQSLAEKTADVQPQVKLLNDQLAVQQSQLDHLINERDRYERLVKAEAATQKQLDDMNAQVDQAQKQMLVTEQQIKVQLNNTGTQNRSIMSESDPLRKQVAQINQQLSKANIVNPINGTVLAKYAEAGEITATGKALYKIADLSYLNLRAYITGVQLPQVKLGQQVKVMIDDSNGKYKTYDGTIIWISGKAEFTPKTIQTKDERANLVYAIKIKVKNDGYLKIGMYGEVKFETADKKQ
ncbi:HlyD family efflux transporter periplasmic adaptor subunit [Panacibacter ginsenosidivorans]|uniref:HlyD family efflux transporter periplasmic adaptor subunit n=1 Tax=Panacibacter ginsenosidivorans TaxID=1813871 RepID=A0A5B8VBV5_9BACT|nr:HlyD family efflux transporter periplasmic adaptor subunit [Panacibacter ginsenosidivorans]QEC68802.1 HlyD family efflux transporter periplasmic adaptor subunit [Panacibacter ginsenosidivorans]